MASHGCIEEGARAAWSIDFPGLGDRLARGTFICWMGSPRATGQPGVQPFQGRGGKADQPLSLAEGFQRRQEPRALDCFGGWQAGADFLRFFWGPGRGRR